MATSKNKFTSKIILSYLVLGTLSVLVGIFLYSEFKNYTAETSENTGGQKFIETGTLINLVYETDGFSRLALLTENDADFEKYRKNKIIDYKRISIEKAGYRKKFDRRERPKYRATPNFEIDQPKRHFAG